jgi:hypothetical protein
LEDFRIGLWRLTRYVSGCYHFIGILIISGSNARENYFFLPKGVRKAS